MNPHISSANGFSTGADASAGEAVGRAASATREQIRGSSVLLLGRVLALGIDFVSQVILVRYLSKSDFGSFALAISVAALGANIGLLGLERTVARFAPIYQEERDYGRMFGTIAVVVGTVLAAGGAVVVGFFLFRQPIGAILNDELALALLTILIFFSPVQALDSLLIGLFASFARARAIFFRRYVLAPVLQLAVISAAALGGASVAFVAAGYVLSAAAGLLIYAFVFVRLLRSTGLSALFRRADLRLPFREIYEFSLPLLASDVVFILRSSAVVIMIGYFGTTIDVADFRAAIPIAGQMLLVATSFKYLYTPSAARAFARRESAASNDLYWQSAVWVAIITFPLFAVVFAFPEPVLILLFGPPYAGSASILSILAVGYFVSSALGFNAQALRVYGRVRFMVLSDLLTAAVGLVATLLLVEAMGALGAAIGTTTTLLLQNVFYQVGLWRGTDVHPLDPRYLRVYLSIVGVAIVLLAIGWLAGPSLPVALGLAAIGSLLVLLMSRRQMRVTEAFPELARVPLVRRLLGTPGGS